MFLGNIDLNIYNFYQPRVPMEHDIQNGYNHSEPISLFVFYWWSVGPLSW
jgi:hypothetical protein